jgi:hypothetical protein
MGALVAGLSRSAGPVIAVDVATEAGHVGNSAATYGFTFWVA